MLKLLKIKNFALLNDVEFELTKGFTVITGETGSGKSILLDALAFLLGKRADVGFIGSLSDKCVIEGKFNLSTYHFKEFFKEVDWEYDDETIVRREFSQNGRSRTFVNDTPVLISDLKTFGDQLIDIHGQHSVQLFNAQKFYFDLIDGISGVLNLRLDYQTEYKKYIALQKEIHFIESKKQALLQEQEFKLFKLNELTKLELKAGEQADLELELSSLSNAEGVKNVVNTVVNNLLNSEFAALDGVKKSVDELKKIEKINPQYATLLSRLQDAWIELKDIAEECNQIETTLVMDNDRLEWVDNRLSALFAVCKKYGVKDADDLLVMFKELNSELGDNNDLEDDLENKKQILAQLVMDLEKRCGVMHIKRQKGIDLLSQQVVAELKDLKMPNSVLQIQLLPTDFNIFGNTDCNFLFSANKGATPEKISKVASGGEMSRLMLVFKKILSNYLSLPTIIFDEIDTGVSGDVASKMASMMQDMAINTQLISITHLPQVAGKANEHLKVWKEHGAENTVAQIKKLTKEERINELAAMLSGAKITSAAIQNAKEILGEA
jgi:DNA repair protein RecN (Recombination protein N)